MPTILTIATNNSQLKRISGSSRSSEVVGLVGVVSFKFRFKWKKEKLPKLGFRSSFKQQTRIELA